MKYHDAAGSEFSAQSVRVGDTLAVQICVNGQTVTVARDDIELVTRSLAKVADQEPASLEVFENANVISANVAEQNIAVATRGHYAWHIYHDGRYAYDVGSDTAARAAVDLICAQDGYLTADAGDVDAWRAIVGRAMVGK